MPQAFLIIFTKFGQTKRKVTKQNNKSKQQNKTIHRTRWVEFIEFMHEPRVFPFVCVRVRVRVPLTIRTSILTNIKIPQSKF